MGDLIRFDFNKRPDKGTSKKPENPEKKLQGEIDDVLVKLMNTLDQYDGDNFDPNVLILFFKRIEVLREKANGLNEPDLAMSLSFISEGISIVLKNSENNLPQQGNKKASDKQYLKNLITILQSSLNEIDME